MDRKRIKKELAKIRLEKIKEGFKDYVNLNHLTETTNLFVEGARWADSHPNGFINDDGYLARLRNSDKSITKAQFIEMLNEFPDDAQISVECCNPRAMVYDAKYNLIRID